MTLAGDLHPVNNCRNNIVLSAEKGLLLRGSGGNHLVQNYIFVLLLHTSCKERNNIWAGGRRIMFIQYGNQNGFCVRPRGEGGVSFEIYTHSPIHTNFHPTPKIVGIFRVFCIRGMGWNLQTKNLFSHIFILNFEI